MPTFNRQSYNDKTIESAAYALINAKHGDYYILTKREMKQIKAAFEIMRKKYYDDGFIIYRTKEIMAPNIEP